MVGDEGEEEREADFGGEEGVVGVVYGGGGGGRGREELGIDLSGSVGCLIWSLGSEKRGAGAGAGAGGKHR